MCNIPSHKYFTLVHPHATVSTKAKIGYDTFIGPQVNVMPNAIIGNHCSFRASANIGHDCFIDNYSYMGPNSTLSGRVNVKKGVHIGPNASVREKVTLGSFCTIGMGSVVLKNIPEDATDTVKRDDMGRFNLLFDQVTELLSKVESKELFPNISVKELKRIAS